MSPPSKGYEYPQRNEHDPYRAARKAPSPASDSSTSRLASASHPVANYSPHDDYEYQEEDPYAIAPRYNPGEKKRHRKRDPAEQRANSYLPYSHHKRDPYAPSEPIYLEEDNLPSFNSPGKDGAVGSILQDNIAMDMVDQNPPRSAGRNKSLQHLEPLPEIKRKKRRCCGLSRRTAVYTVFALCVVTAVVCYFVWPRIPVLRLLDSGLNGSANSFITTNATYELDADWLVNMTVDNTANWVPTRVNDFAVKIIDMNSGQSFGKGNSGFLVVPPKGHITVSIPMSIYYKAWSPTDITWQDLYTACGPQKQNPMPEEQISLNVRFEVTYYIAGMIGTQVASVVPSNGFACPTD
ncbi:hypothetical protein BDF14DRAFT_186456 [Spinellus fusiger]|nr:hypothetical protein BDF14DRAFT_186456 [Spinellus fusiger]